VEAYNKEGILVAALTPQNEPLQNDPSYPTTLLTADQEIEIVKLLSPLLPNDTEIWSFDHNWDLVDYAYHVLADPDARKVVAGTAFHLYGGQPSSMTKLKNAYPDHRIFFSEGSEFKVRGAQQMVEIFQNYASTYNAWVTMLDTNMQPNAGPFKPLSTLIELDTATKTPIYRFEFYMLGQFSKFVRRGALRIQSSLTFLDSDVHRDRDENGEGKGERNGDKDVTVVAFINPQDPSIADEKNRGAIVVIVVNPASTQVRLQVRLRGNLSSVVTLPPNSVSTLRWRY
jgi:glucosylceramidase